MFFCEQHYSKIALKYCQEKGINEITRGDIDTLEALLTLFGGENIRETIKNNLVKNGKFSLKKYSTAKLQYVMGRLDFESKQATALFEKTYIHYKGLINRPTRCFKIKNIHKGV